MKQWLKFLPMLCIGILFLPAAAAAADTVWVGRVLSDSYYVSLGQTVYVQVGIMAGDTDVTISASDSVSFLLTDTQGNRYDTRITSAIYTPALPRTITRNTTETLTFSVLLSGALCTGALQLDAACTGSIDSGGLKLLRSDTRAALVDTWVVQSPASVSFVALTFDSDTGSARLAANHDTVVLRLCFRNTGEGSATYLPDTTAIALRNAAGVTVTSLLTWDTWPASPRYIAGHGYDTFSFILRLPDTRSQQVMGDLVAFVTGTAGTLDDSNGLGGLTVTRTADTPTLTVYFALNTVAGDTAYACDSGAWISFPPNRLNAGTEVTIRSNPSSSALTAADQQLATMATWQGVTSTTYEVSLTRAADTPTQVDMLLNIRYGDTGMTATEEASVRIMRLVGNSWSELTDSNTPSTATNVAQVALGSLSFFRCILTNPVFDDLNNVRVFPNPFIPHDGDANTGSVYTGAINTGITFVGLTGNAKIRIFTLDGTLVDAEEVGGSGNWQWDAKNSRGQECASGTYFYLITNSGGGLAKGTLCIIR